MKGLIFVAIFLLCLILKSNCNANHTIENLKIGRFVNDGLYFASGIATLIHDKTAQKHYLKMQDFSSSFGPALFSYLSPYPDGRNGIKDAFKLESIRHGNYSIELKPEVVKNITDFQSVLIWCEPFVTLFGHATLNTTLTSGAIQFTGSKVLILLSTIACILFTL